MSLFQLLIQGNTPAELLTNLQAAVHGMTAGAAANQTTTDGTKPADDKKANAAPASTEGRRRGRAAPAPEKPPVEEKTEEKKTETTQRRSRAGTSKKAEETEEQKKLREDIYADAADLANVPEAIPQVTEFLQRKGCKLISDLLADDLDEAAEFLDGLCAKYFDPE